MRISRILTGLAVGAAIIGIFLVFLRQGPTTENSAVFSGSGSSPPPDGKAPARADFQALVGKWIRHDGGYLISVRSVDSHGGVDAGYFNPRPINVSRAEASIRGEVIKLFVELQASGYPGSTYELNYDPSKDVLVGTYFQAAIQKQFEVAFTRVRASDSR